MKSGLVRPSVSLVSKRKGAACVVSGRLNVVKVLNEHIKLLVLEEVHI
jgi:hypothetical protein